MTWPWTPGIASDSNVEVEGDSAIVTMNRDAIPIVFSVCTREAGEFKFAATAMNADRVERVEVTVNSLRPVECIDLGPFEFEVDQAEGLTLAR